MNQEIKNVIEERLYSAALNPVLRYLEIPSGYELKSIQPQMQNKNKVLVFRYEKATGENNGYGGEHFSFVVEESTNKILGLTWMDQRFSSGEIPSKERTKEVAKQFLNTIQSGLFDKLENLWIEPHDEVVSIKYGTKNIELTVTGMKYKCYLPQENNYAWVIVGSNDSVITFEQGIKWEGSRITEKWLHDNWINNNF